MKSKGSTKLFAALAIIVFVVAIITSGIALNAGIAAKNATNEYKTYSSTEISVTPNQLSANSEQAMAQIKIHKATLTKFFAISILLYLALITMLILIYFNTVKYQDTKEKNSN